MMWYGGPMMGYGGWFGWVGMIMGFFIFIVLIVGVVYLLRWVFSNSSADYSKQGSLKDKYKRSEEALEILKSRYAKGEITKEQFESMKKDIGVY